MAVELRSRCIDPSLFDTHREIVIDTDTKNEIDDQFALVFALLSPTLTVGAIYAGQFSHKPEPPSHIGMEQSYQEILRILEILDLPKAPPVYRGNRYPLATHPHTIEGSDAVEDLIARARAVEDYLPIVSIGAPTNLGNALLLAPDIAAKILVVWLGGNEYHMPEVAEYNLMGDLTASQILFHSKVAMIRFPAQGVTSKMAIDATGINELIKPHGTIGEFLADRYTEYVEAHNHHKKEIWDLATVGVLESPHHGAWEIQPMPYLTEIPRWEWPGEAKAAEGTDQHCVITDVDDKAIFGALSRRLEAF